IEDVLFRSARQARLPGCRIWGQYPAPAGEGRDGRTRGNGTAARVPRSPWRTDQESGSGSARGRPEAITVVLGSPFPRRRSGGHGGDQARRPSTRSLGAPIVIVGALLSVSVVGALQVRQDDRLNERGSLRLMADPLRRRPLVLTRRPGGEAGGRTR